MIFMKNGRKYFTSTLAAAISFCCIFGSAVPVSAAYGDKAAIVEESEDSITFQIGDIDYDYLTISADNNCFYWKERTTDYYAVTLEEGMSAPEDWNVVALETVGQDGFDVTKIHPWEEQTFDFSEFDENTVVLADVADPQKLYETDGILHVYQMNSVVSQTTSFGLGGFAVHTDSGVQLTLEDFSQIPEVVSVGDAMETANDTQSVYEVQVNNGFSGSLSETAEQAKVYFETIKDLQQVEKVHCAIPQCIVRDASETTPTTYTLTRIADPDAYGDIDSDGAVNADDAYRVLAYYAEQSVGKADAKLTAPDADKFAEAAAFCAGDVNGDGMINGDDAYGILCYYAAASVGKTPDWNSIF